MPATNSTLFPDWTIRELFFHLQPDLVEDHTLELWNKVGGEVKDQLSIGRLQIWGREIHPTNRRRSPLTEIDKTYWFHASFTYWFLDENHKEISHTRGPQGSGLAEYCDLRVNKSQALAIWPMREGSAGRVRLIKSFFRPLSSWKTNLSNHPLVVAVVVIASLATIWQVFKPEPPIAVPATVPTSTIAPPSVVLLPAPGQLQIHNRGKSDIYLWGNKLEGFPADMDKEFRIIPAGNYYYLFTDRLQKAAMSVIGQNGEKLFSLETYLSDDTKRRWIAKFGLLIKMKNGEMEIHTQNLGVRSVDNFPN